MSVAVGFDAVWQSLQAGIGAKLVPALQMERGGILDAGDLEQRCHDERWYGVANVRSTLNLGVKKALG